MKGEGIRSIYRNNLNQTAFFISPASGAPRQNRPLISKRLHHHFLISFQITFSLFCWLGLGLSLSFRRRSIQLSRERSFQRRNPSVFLRLARTAAIP